MTDHPLIITDIDNTLFNWVDYFAPAFRAMVHVLHDATSVAETQLTQEFRAIFQNYGTLEYSFVLQRLPSLACLPADDLDALIARVAIAFGRSRNKRMQPYPGVTTTLRWAVSQGIPVVAVSNAPIYFAITKLRRLGLIQYVHAIAAWEGPPIPVDDARARRYTALPRVRTSLVVIPVPADQRKPSTAMYELVLRQFGRSPSGAWSIGDSFHGDMLPSLALGVNPLWARYGLAFDENNLATVRQLTPGGPRVTDAAYAAHSSQAAVPALAAFSEIQEHIPTPQTTLF